MLGYVDSLTIIERLFIKNYSDHDPRDHLKYDLTPIYLFNEDEICQGTK